MCTCRIAWWAPQLVLLLGSIPFSETDASDALINRMTHVRVGPSIFHHPPQQAYWKWAKQILSTGRQSAGVCLLHTGRALARFSLTIKLRHVHGQAASEWLLGCAIPLSCGMSATS